MTSRPWSLERRLVVGILALLTVTSIVVGTVSAIALHGFLLDRLDTQLISATTRSQGQLGDRRGDGAGRDPSGAGGPRDAGGESFLPGQGSGTVGAVIESDGTVVRGIFIDDNGTLQVLTAEQAARIAGVMPGSSPVTVALGGEFGRYRMIAASLQDGAAVVVGLPMDEVRGTILRLIGIIAFVTAIALAVVAAVGPLVVRLALRPLGRVVAIAGRVAELRLDKGEVALGERVPASDADARTEVGKVGASLNRMLEHVASALTARQASENKVRQFVADASHELRTPLASIRGYSELTRRGGHDLPPDVVHSLSRIESESIRMTKLVEDLLLLARLDSGPDIRLDRVDLGRVLVDATSDAYVAALDHQWELVVPEEPVEVLGDGARLHQVVVNLLANAASHTPPGTTVTVTVQQSGADAVLTVADNGPGISPELQSSLFERFVRGDSSRSRAAGSTGLGLAIVAAVVDAHGGTVRVNSEPGATVFTVCLPLADGAH